MEGSRWPFSQPVSPESLERQTAEFERDVAEAQEAGSDPHALIAVEGRLGRAYAVTGRTREAVEILADRLATAERELGPDDALTLVARSDVAWAMLKTGKVSEALAGHTQVVASLERILGAEDAVTAAARSSLGSAQQQSRQRDPAIRSLEQALRDLTDTVGADHPDAVLCRIRLATAYRATGATVVEAVVADLGHELGTGDALILDTQFVLADLYLKAGRKQESGEPYSEILPDLTRLYGPDHQVTKLARARRARPRGIRLCR